MEKVIYLLWTPHEGEAHRNSLATHLRDAGIASARLNVADAEVEPASGLRQQHMVEQPQAILQVWVDSAVRSLRAPVDDAVALHCRAFDAYLVTESHPLRNERFPAQAGQRTAGFAQIALLRRPPAIEHGEWLKRWLDGHTPVAIETQSTFEYVQNAVARPLRVAAERIDAVVEECFPAEAMTDPHVFFDGAGDAGRFQRNLARMMESVGRFLELPLIDVFATSQYTLI